MDLRHRRDHHHPPQPPSFSASLLEAIYRSCDADDSSSPAAAAHSRRRSPDPSVFITTYRTTSNSNTKSSDYASITRSRDNSCYYNRRRCGGGVRLSSSSSDCGSSGYGGFSSSDAESVHSAPIPRPIRTDPCEKKKKSSSIRSRFKPPISPGSKLVAFLNSIFSAAGAKKPKLSVAVADIACGEDSGCSSASSYSRSCLSKASSVRSRGEKDKRSVRFGPICVLDRTACSTRPVQSRTEPNSLKRVEDLLRRMEEDDGDDDDDVASDGSSDLFELENLTVVGGATCKYADELPVYETTHLGANLAIAQGLIR